MPGIVNSRSAETPRWRGGNRIGSTEDGFTPYRSARKWTTSPPRFHSASIRDYDLYRSEFLSATFSATLLRANGVKQPSRHSLRFHRKFSLLSPCKMTTTRFGTSPRRSLPDSLMHSLIVSTYEARAFRSIFQSAFIPTRYIVVITFLLHSPNDTPFDRSLWPLSGRPHELQARSRIK